MNILTHYAVCIKLCILQHQIFDQPFKNICLMLILDIVSGNQYIICVQSECKSPPPNIELFMNMHNETLLQTRNSKLHIEFISIATDFVTFNIIT